MSGVILLGGLNGIIISPGADEGESSVAVRGV